MPSSVRLAKLPLSTRQITRQISRPAKPLSLRHFSSSTAMSADWSAAQYLKFNDERTRAVHDLVSRVPLPGGRFPASDKTASLRIVDLGCGPANSTQVLVDRFPGASIAGVDSSPNMIDRAQKTLPDVDFEIADLTTYEPGPADLLLANAVFQWVSLEQRLATILRLLGGLKSGGVLAYQVPDNKEEPSHRAMREVGRGESSGLPAGEPSLSLPTGEQKETVSKTSKTDSPDKLGGSPDKLGGSPSGKPPGKPWVPYLHDLVDRDPIEPPQAIYDALVPHATVDIWHTSYYHILPGGPRDIVEWVKGTGLQPFVNALPEGEVREAYIKAYEERLGELYQRRADGSVMIKYPRLFVVAVKR